MLRHPQVPVGALRILALAGLAAACSDRQPIGLSLSPGVSGQVLTCAADMRAQTLSCAAPSGRASKLSADVILGGQGIYVQLTSSNVSYDAGTEIFQADVTVQNLTAVPLGTPDGMTVSGVKVFFYSGPVVVSGTGTVTVGNADGTGTFTGTNQPYFFYNQILQTAQVSAAKTWQWVVPTTVGTFTFQVLVVAAAPGPVHTWTAKAPIPTPRVGAAAGVVSGVLYVVGGQEVTGSALGTVEAYDPVADAWSTKAPMPTARVGVGAGVIDGILYAVGGDVSDNGSIVGTLEAYDPATNTWTTKAPMHTPRRSPAVGVINGLLYVVGGGNSIGTTYTTLEAYDPATDTWSAKAPMPTSRWVLGAGVINGVLYAVGGDNGAEPPSNAVPFPTVEAYDPATNTWSSEAPMPTARCCLGVGVINGTLYAVGGASNDAATASLYATAEAYNAVTDTWSTETALPMPRTFLTVAVIGGALFAVGGYDGTNELTSTLALTPYNPEASRAAGSSGFVIFGTR